MLGTLKYHRMIIFMNLFEIAESLRNVPKFAQMLNWWRHSAFRYSFSDNGSHFFELSCHFYWGVSASIDLLDIKSHKNCLALPRWCFKENYHWFWASVHGALYTVYNTPCSILQWRHMPRENFNSFLRGPKNGELWQAITSSKLNIFDAFFCSFRFLKEILFRKLKKRANFGDCLPFRRGYLLQIKK